MTTVPVYVARVHPDGGGRQVVWAFSVRPDLWSVGSRWFAEPAGHWSQWTGWPACWTVQSRSLVDRRLSQALAAGVDRPGVGEALILGGLGLQESYEHLDWRVDP